MRDNFRSCQQIQNYSNLLCEETRHLYTSTDNLENIVWLTPNSTWASEVIQCIDTTQKTALLRFKKADAKSGASELSDSGVPFTFIPQLPIADITTETAWLYSAIAKYFVLDKYSVYDLIADIPVEGNESRKAVNTVKNILVSISKCVIQNDSSSFAATVADLAKYLGYDTRKDHIDKLYSIVSDNRYHVAFDTEQYQNIAITFHSSKGLEFDQVILFAEDYSLNDNASIYNHYVAVTRARHKVVIVKLNNNYACRFQNNLSYLFLASGKKIDEMVTYK